MSKRVWPDPPPPSASHTNSMTFDCWKKGFAGPLVLLNRSYILTYPQQQFYCVTIPLNLITNFLKQRTNTMKDLTLQVIIDYLEYQKLYMETISDFWVKFSSMNQEI